jgi:hypothetical protein
MVFALKQKERETPFSGQQGSKTDAIRDTTYASEENDE